MNTATLSTNAAAAQTRATGHLATIARFTVVEAWRARLFLWAGLAALLAACASLFVVELAVTDVERMKAGLMGGPLRLAAVFSLTALVASSMVRELQDKVAELVLAMAVPRHAFFLGKLAGFCACAVGMAFIFALPVMPWQLPWHSAANATAWAGWAVWAISLALELCLLAGVALLTVLAFGHVALALGSTLAFYVLARLLADLQLIARMGLANDTLASRASDGVLGALGLALPRLDLFTRTQWLAEGVSAAVLAPLAGQVLLYLALLAAVGLWDLYRREW